MTDVSNRAEEPPASTLPLPHARDDSGSLQRYARQLRHDLPAEVFRATPERLWWMPFHLAVIGLAAAGIIAGGFGIGVRLLLSVVIGHSFGCLSFLAHEIVHGTVVRSRRWQNVTATICLSHYLLSPGHWRTWHNRFHHGRTNRPGDDPDGFGDIVMIRRHKIARVIARFAPGTRYLRSFLFPFYWFSAQVVLTLFLHSKYYGYWSPRRRRKHLAQFWALAAFWAGVWALVGSYNFLFLYLVPVACANVLQMGYISTNHLLCDENVDHNDPLVNTLSVTVPRWMDWLHLNYSHHVEHHICPVISPKFAPRVREALVARHGRQYRQMPLWKALKLVYATPRIYLAENELVDLRSGEVYSTLGRDGEDPMRLDPVPLPVRPRRKMLRVKRLLRGASEQNAVALSEEEQRAPAA